MLKWKFPPKNLPIPRNGERKIIDSTVLSGRGIMLVPRRVDWIEGTTISILFSHKILRAVPNQTVETTGSLTTKKNWVSPTNSLKPPLADKCSTVLPILSGVLGEPGMHQTPCPLAVKWVGSQVIPEYKVFGKLPKQKQNRGTSTIDDL